MMNHKVRINFEVTLKNEDQRDELLDLITYAVEVFAVPEDARRVREMNEQAIGRPMVE
ncbi:MAG: hypothetical protein GY866_23895 [Proteobacteria bacterium]|nr:hypothetical protein [Pseudomonadota bacterium]